MSAGSVNYRNGIRSAVRGLWGGSLDIWQFGWQMEIIVRNGLTLAWYEGAKECGILPADLSLEERSKLRQAIANEDSHIDSFGADIEANSKKNGGKVGPLFARAEAWINRYLDVVNRAKVFACADRKMAWRLGATKVHCVDCSNLNGKVKRASQWAAYGIRPQSPELACGGFRCLCYFEVTDEPMSRGPLPRLKGPG